MYGSWTPQETLNKQAKPFIGGWRYLGDRFNKSIHTSTYIFAYFLSNVTNDRWIMLNL